MYADVLPAMHPLDAGQYIRSALEMDVFAAQTIGGIRICDQNKWDNFPPYLYCRDVNGGDCPLFKKALTPEEQEAKRKELKQRAK